MKFSEFNRYPVNNLGQKKKNRWNERISEDCKRGFEVNFRSRSNKELIEERRNRRGREREEFGCVEERGISLNSFNLCRTRTLRGAWSFGWVSPFILRGNEFRKILKTPFFLFHFLSFFFFFFF
jgi:hypothetical protein